MEEGEVRVEELRMSAEQLRNLASSVISIKVSGIKPREEA